MRKSPATAMCRSLYNSILSLGKDARSISPENVRYIAPNCIVPVAPPAGSGIEIDDSANINGLDGLKINRALLDIDSNKKKLLVISGTFIVDSLNFEKKIPVPSGFDGRNSFVTYTGSAEISGHSDKPLRLWVTRNRDSIDFALENSIGDDSRRLLYIILLWRYV